MLSWPENMKTASVIMDRLHGRSSGSLSETFAITSVDLLLSLSKLFTSTIEMESSSNSTIGMCWFSRTRSRRIMLELFPLWSNISKRKIMSYER